MSDYYDIIILGGGASGLSCALELMHSTKSILILEKEAAKNNDRTWSYWEKDKGKYDHLITSKWNKLSFYGTKSFEHHEIAPYQYKMLRSSDFYKFAHKELEAFPNVTYLNDEVTGISENKNMVKVKTVKGEYQSRLVLDGITIPKVDPLKTYFVAQHFGGWFIKTKNASFDPDNAVFMDFRIDQEEDTRFFYVLPIHENLALVEIAIFSNEIQDMAYYDRYIENYIRDYLKIDHYEIEEKEKGVIPMTSYNFDQHNSDKVIRIGTAGGWVKPSSGYAFKRIMDRSQKLAQQIIEGKKVNVSSSPWYKWLDKTMLKAILLDYVSGKETFEALFDKRSFQEVFKFLDEENSLFEDLKSMYSAPILPFTKAALIPKTIG